MSLSVGVGAGVGVGVGVGFDDEPPPHPVIVNAAVALATAPAPTTNFRRETDRCTSSFNFSTGFPPNSNLDFELRSERLPGGRHHLCNFSKRNCHCSELRQ